MSGFVFPPDSQIWRISRENALLLGGPAAAILQVAHPEIAAGVAAHSQFRSDALGRLHRTLEAIYIVTFGTRGEAERLRNHVAALHEKVRGGRPVPYDAFSPDAQLWVLATLIVTGTWVFEELIQPLTPREREAHYREMRVFGSYFGLDPEYGPRTLEEFQKYYDDMLRGPVLGSHPLCREVAWAVAKPRKPVWLRALSMLTVGLVAETLPSPVRERLGFRSTAGSSWGFRVARRVLRAVVPLLPARLRFTPRYLAAQGG